MYCVVSAGVYTVAIHIHCVSMDTLYTKHYTLHTYTDSTTHTVGVHLHCRATSTLYLLPYTTTYYVVDTHDLTVHYTCTNVLGLLMRTP